MRAFSLFVLALALALSSSAAETRGKKPAPYISETVVIAPHQVGDFLLRDMSYDPKQKAAGVGVRYAHVHHPDVRIDVFVYPAGRQSESEAVSAGMQELRESFAIAEQKGYYRDVKMGDVTAFEIKRQHPVVPEAAALPAVPRGDTAATTIAADANVAADPMNLPALLKPMPIKGERIALSVTDDDTHVRSRGYIFYKQLYYFKGRISASDRELAQPDFERLTDQAMRALVPAVQTLNIGSCAAMTIHVDTSQKDQDKQIAALIQATSEAMQAQERDGCVGELSPEERVRRTSGSQTVSLMFDASDWSPK